MRSKRDIMACAFVSRLWRRVAIRVLTTVDFPASPPLRLNFNHPIMEHIQPRWGRGAAQSNKRNEARAHFSAARYG
jgi:hypothetical protein